MTTEALEKAILNPDFMLKVLTELKKEKDARIAAEAKVAEREATIEAMTPAANLGNAVSSTPACITVKELAHLITQNGTKIGQNRLFDWLVENGYIYETGRNYKVYQKYLERGLFRVQEEVYNPSGTEIEKIYMKVMITGKGQDYFLDLFKNN